MAARSTATRKGCYRLFEAFHALLREATRRRGSAMSIHRKWWFIAESLRLSIRSKHERLSKKLVCFVVQSMYIAADTSHAEHALVCDAFAAATLVKHQRIPLMDRLMLAHFFDIERHQVTAIDCQPYVAERKEPTDIRNRRISSFYNRAWCTSDPL